MVAITKYFGIPEVTPFLDVDVYTDTKQFIDPFRIMRESRFDEHSAKADKLIRHYSSLLCAKIISPSHADQLFAQQMLQYLNEPRETRIGWSKEGYNGRGVDTFFSKKITEALQGDLRALISVGAFNWIGALPLFIENFDSDRMSDVTTAIIRDVLIDFTVEMVSRYPEFHTNGHTLVPHTLKVWDSTAQSWANRTELLPYADGHALLLIPDCWAGDRIQLHGRRFYEVPVLGFIQDEQLIANPKAPVTKKALMEMSQYRDIYSTNIAITLRAMREGIDLCEKLIQRASQWLDYKEAA